MLVYHSIYFLIFLCMIYVAAESISMESALIFVQILVSKYLYLEPATLALLKSLANSLNFDARNRHVKYCELYDNFVKHGVSLLSQITLGGIQFLLSKVLLLSSSHSMPQGRTTCFPL